MPVDPVCKMYVDDRTAEFKSEYKGDMYYFCAPACKKAFDEAPEKYIMPDDDNDATPPCGRGCCGCA